MVGFEPTEMPVLQEAYRRKLGTINISDIKIIGDFRTPQKLIAEAFEKLKKSV